MCALVFKCALQFLKLNGESSAPPRHSEERIEPTHMGDVRDVESPAWNDYLAFFVIPSLPRNLAKRKNIINAPMARFSGLRFAPLRMT